MRLLEIENVIAIHEDDIFKIVIDDKEEIKIERYEDGWILWDNGDCLLFDKFKEALEHVQDLATRYDLFSKEWYSEYYDTFKIMLSLANNQYVQS